MSGPAGHAPLQSHYPLGERPSLLPPHRRGLQLLLQADVRDLARLQDGRPPHQLHLSHAHKHEQAKVIESEVNLWLGPAVRVTIEGEDPALTPPFTSTWDDIWPE